MQRWRKCWAISKVSGNFAYCHVNPNGHTLLQKMYGIIICKCECNLSNSTNNNRLGGFVYISYY